MFGLLHNLYKYIHKQNERKITLVTLGLDGAGKTTAINTIQGELDKEATPTFGFNSETLTEGKYKVEIFDLGGGQNIRRIWSTYLSEVHGVVYVVDAADPQRFEESRAALEEVLKQAHLHDKPVLVYANKQDLPTAATGPEIAVALGLIGHKHNRFNIMGCVARTPAGQHPDVRLRDGIRWLVSQVNSVFSTLNPRVQAEAGVVKAEEMRKKREREEKVRKIKEERLRKQEEERLTAEAATTAEPHQEQANALALLPNQIASPMKASPPGAPIGESEPWTVASAGGGRGRLVSGGGGGGLQSSSSGGQTDFSDLQRGDQSVAAAATAGLQSRFSNMHASAPPPRVSARLAAVPSGEGSIKRPDSASGMRPPTPPTRHESSSHAACEGASSVVRQTSGFEASLDGGRRSNLARISANKVSPEPAALLSDHAPRSAEVQT